MISGYYGFDNLGDEAILSSLISTLKTLDQKIEIIVLSNNPATTSKKYDVSSIYRYNYFDILAEMRKSDILISGGGSLLQDVTGYKTIPYYLSIIYLAVLNKMETVFFAQGVGPVDIKFNRFLIKKVLNKTDYLSVRDSRSKNLLRKIGIKKDIKIVSDPVFLKQNCLSTNKTTSNKTELKVGISVRDWEDNRYFSCIVDYLNRLGIKRDILVKIIVFHKYQDLKISRKLNETLDVDSILKTYPDKLSKVNDFYQGLDLFIGLRLHSLIFSAVNCIPFIGISYDPKVKSLIEEMGYQELITTKSCNLDILMESTENIFNNYDQIKETIRRKCEEKADNIKDYLSEIILDER